MSRTVACYAEMKASESARQSREGPSQYPTATGSGAAMRQDGVGLWLPGFQVVLPGCRTMNPRQPTTTINIAASPGVGRKLLACQKSTQ